MTFSNSSKNIREFIFHKIIKLIDSFHSFFKYLGHMGQKTDRSVMLLIHTIHFLKNWSHFRKVPSVILSLIVLVIMGRYESQNCLRILAGIAPWNFAFFEFELMISGLTSFSCTFLKSNLSENLSKLDLILIILV